MGNMVRSVWSSVRRSWDKVCHDCGCDFVSASIRAQRCPDCAESRHRERTLDSAHRLRSTAVARLHAANQRNWDNLKFEIVHDPTGDFRPAARLTDCDLKSSLDLAVLPVGMLIRDRKANAVFSVAPFAGGRLTLVPHATD